MSESSEVVYLIGIRSKFVKAEEPIGSDTESLWDLVIESTAFTPREENGSLCLSLSSESCTVPIELVDILRQKGKSYRAVAKLTEAELEANGFHVDQDDTPWTGHTNACLSNGLSRRELRALAKGLAELALDRGVIVFNC